MKQVYPDVPELDWLDVLVVDLTLMRRYAKESKQLMYVYKYLLWDQRFKRSEIRSDKWLIAFGFVLKYHHLIFDKPLSKQDQKTVALSEEQYKKLRRGEKLS